MTRSDVFKVLKHEREYQMLRWGVEDGEAMVDKPKSIPEYILYMEHHLRLAREAASTLPDDDPEALAQLRKVTALGLACFEQHGVPLRPGGHVQNGHNGKYYWLPDLVL